jgi:DNA modification methylase
LPLRVNTLYNQDCLAGLKKKLEDGVVDLAFADPPFNIGYQYDCYDDRLESEKYLAWSRDWTAEVVRVLRPEGTFWLAIGDEYAAEVKVMLQREHKLACRGWVVWYYTFGVNCTHKFSRSHAHLLYMVKDPQRFTFNADDPAIRVPSARQLVYADKRANPKGRLPDDTWILRPQDLPEGFRAEEDTWYFPRVCGTFMERAGWHGCQMPEQLLGRIIRACSNEGDLVLDPFAGSGTTLAVAKKLGRQFLGFELSKEYSQQIRQRLAGIKRGDVLDGPPEPLLSAPNTASGRRLQDVKRSTKGRVRNQAPAQRR